MTQPTSYARTFSFTDDQAQAPSGHVPGVSLDAEYDAIATSLKGILANLALIQRDDGALKNAIVTLDALSPAVLSTLGAGGTWAPRGVWLPATQYALGDVVEVATATYVNSAVHLSAATFAAEAAGTWIKLYDDAGSTPADGSVTAAKFALGAVNDAALGITTFDITGAGRAQGGIAAGTAPKGALLHAKLDGGDVFAKTERKTDAQGAVGYKIIGVGATWTWQMASGSNDLQLELGGTPIVTYSATDGAVDFAEAVRSAGGDPTAGAGAHLSYIAGIGYLTARDYTGNAWKDLKVRGANVYLQAAGVDVLKATSTNVDFPKGLTNNGIAVGFLGIPQKEEDAAYTILASDVGENIYSANTVAQTITVPVLPADSAVLIINDGAQTITLQGSGTTLKLAGTATTGNRTVGAGGMAFLKWVKDGTRVFVSGPGVA